MDVGKKIDSSLLFNNNGKYKINKSSIENNDTKFTELLNKLNDDDSNENEVEEDSKEPSISKFMDEKSSNNVYGGQKTDRGTKILQPGEDMDKNAFLKILAAQMSNQDPTQPQDGTEYISQFAQFAAMEQMSNLNSTMSGFASQSLIGRGVMLNAYDNNGNLISGVVRSVSQNGSKIIMGVEYLNEKGEAVMGEFENDDIASVIGIQDSRLDYINNNMTMLVGSGMIDKTVEFISSSEKIDGDSPQKYETMTGTVESVVVENYYVKLKVRVDETGELQTVAMDKVIKVDGEQYTNNF